MNPSDSSRPLVLWRLTDGKRGHENQTLGLEKSLRRKRDLDCHEIPVSSPGRGLLNWFAGRFPEGQALPQPDLILAAGHGTHFHLLAARRSRGGRAVVLMRPSLPLSLFDLCLIPEHDNPPARDNVLPTIGVLNGLGSEGAHDSARTLILIGGPSRHHQWCGKDLLGQLQALFGSEPDTVFTLTTSRRTPADFLESLARLDPVNCRIVPLSETGPEWVAEQLSRSACAWVTEDSVSMIYESLTAGCSVGLLEMTSLGDGRVSKGVGCLVRRGWVTRFSDWRQHQSLARPRNDFCEADRCAGGILELWFSPDLTAPATKGELSRHRALRRGRCN